MPRIAKPHKRKVGNQLKYVTKAGGRLKILCPVSDGLRRANALLAEHLQALKQEEQAGSSPAAPLTVKQAVYLFLKKKERERRAASTLKTYDDYLTRFREEFGDRELASLTLADAEKYHDKLLTGRHRHPIKATEPIKVKGDYVAKIGGQRIILCSVDDGLGRAKSALQKRVKELEERRANAEMSPCAINKFIQYAKSVMNHAVELKRIPANPWAEVEPLPENERERLVTDEEFDRLLTACEGAIAYRGKITKEESIRTKKEILKVLRWTAMRPGELRHLRWGHLHLDGENAAIIIPANEHKTSTTAKNPKPRIIPVLEEGARVLQERRERFGHLPFVFCNSEQGEWSKSAFSRWFERLRERAGLAEPDHNGERISAYNLRHSRLTEAGVDEGMDFFTLMLYAGHSTAQMTERYIHPSKEQLARAVREGAKRREARQAE